MTSGRGSSCKYFCGFSPLVSGSSPPNSSSLKFQVRPSALLCKFAVCMWETPSRQEEKKERFSLVCKFVLILYIFQKIIIIIRTRASRRNDASLIFALPSVAFGTLNF